MTNIGNGGFLGKGGGQGYMICTKGKTRVKKFQRSYNYKDYNLSRQRAAALHSCVKGGKPEVKGCPGL